MSKRPSARLKRRAPKSSQATGRGAARRAGRGRDAAGAATSSHVHLPEHCTLAEVHDLKSKLAALLKAESPVCIDMRGVQRVDTASLQLLAAFARDRRASRLVVELRGQSAAFEEGIRLLGLRRLFDPALAGHAV